MVFKRLHSYHEFEGSGVGLSICKKIIEKHNGCITAQSKPDEGSTFIIGLPEKQSGN
jgi:light-regulated signal transduction histidine kinase (bacteriophytochrome)